MVKYADKSCERCGWKFATFHICLDLPLHVMRRVEDAQVKRVRRSPRRDPRSDAYRGTDEWRANLSAARQEYEQRRRAANRDRDDAICRRYSEDDRTIRELAVEFHISYPTVVGILHRARDEGDLVMRPAAVRIRS